MGREAKSGGVGKEFARVESEARRRKGADLDAGFGAGQMLSAEHFLLDLLN